jgi:hypothetical protein
MIAAWRNPLEAGRRMTMRSPFPILPSLATALLGIGLGGCDGGPLPRVLVQGKVCYHGVPLSTGVIVFIPDAGHGCHGPMACGLVQRDGSYHLQTEDQPGVAAGWYRVTVAAVEAATAPGQDLAIPRSLVPEKYRDPDLSGLVREVKAEQENTIDFNLE